MGGDTPRFSVSMLCGLEVQRGGAQHGRCRGYVGGTPMAILAGVAGVGAPARTANLVSSDYRVRCECPCHGGA